MPKKIDPKVKTVRRWVVQAQIDGGQDQTSPDSAFPLVRAGSSVGLTVSGCAT